MTYFTKAYFFWRRLKNCHDFCFMFIKEQRLPCLNLLPFLPGPADFCPRSKWSLIGCSLYLIMIKDTKSKRTSKSRNKIIFLSITPLVNVCKYYLKFIYDFVFINLHSHREILQSKRSQCFVNTDITLLNVLIWLKV